MDFEESYGMSTVTNRKQYDMVVLDSGEIVAVSPDRYFTRSAAAKKIGISPTDLCYLLGICKSLQSGVTTDGQISDSAILGIKHIYLPRLIKEMEDAWADAGEAEEILGGEVFALACKTGSPVEKCKRFGRVLYNREDVAKFAEEWPQYKEALSARKSASSPNRRTRSVGSTAPKVTAMSDAEGTRRASRRIQPGRRRTPRNLTGQGSSLDPLRKTLLSRQSEELKRLQLERDAAEEALLQPVRKIALRLEQLTVEHREQLRSEKLQSCLTRQASKKAKGAFVREAMTLAWSDVARRYFQAEARMRESLVLTLEAVAQTQSKEWRLGFDKLILTLESISVLKELQERQEQVAREEAEASLLAVRSKPRPWLDKSEKPCRVLPLRDVSHRTVEIAQARSLIESGKVGNELVSVTTAAELFGEDLKTVSCWTSKRQLETIKIFEFKSKSTLIPLLILIPWFESDYCRFPHFSYTEMGKKIADELSIQLGRQVDPINRVSVGHWVRDGLIEEVQGPGGQSYISMSQFDKCLELGKRAQRFILNKKVKP